MSDSQSIVAAVKGGVILGAGLRIPIALVMELIAKKPVDSGMLSRILEAAVRSAAIVGTFSGLYRLCRVLLKSVFKADGDVWAIFISAGIASQALLTFSPAAAKEIFLYALKFAAEGVINSAQSHGVDPPPILSRLAAFIIMGSLIAVYEKEPQHLKSTAVKPLNLLFQPKK